MTAAGGLSPCLRHKIAPSSIHRRIAGHSAFSFSASSRSLHWNRYVEKDHVNPAPHGLVNVREPRPMVPGNHQFKRRRESKKVLAHKPGADFIAAGQGLDFRLRPSPALLGFNRRYEPGAHEPGEIGTVHSP